MKKDFQEVQRDSLIDEIVDLIEYAEGEIVTDSDGIGREYAGINVNWANENTVRVILGTRLSRYDVHFKKDARTEARAEKVFDIVKGEDRKSVLCFMFGMMLNRMRRSDVQSMIAYAKEVRQRRREIEEDK
jgi:hypothetical protein